MGGAAFLGLAASGAAWSVLSAGEPAPGREVLSADEVALVDALADANFPPGNAIGVAGREVDVAGALDGWVGSMGASEQRIVRSLLHLIDQWPRLSLGGVARFSGLPLAERIAVLQRFEHSSLELRRAIGQLTRALISLPYFEDPRVLAGLGVRYGCPVPLLSPAGAGEAAG